MKDRIEWIDLAKGMSIILVAYGHMGIAGIPILGEWLSSFRMPFFFLVSGLLFNASKYPTLTSFIKRRWATLIRPFFLFSALVLAGYWFLEPDTIIDRIESVVRNGWGGYALWFIPVLLGTEICYYLICHYCDKDWKRIALMIPLALAGYACYKSGIPNPWNVCFILTSTLFYGMGNMLSSHLKTFYATADIPRLSIATFVFLAISGCYSLNHPRPEFFVNSLGGGGF